METFFLIVDVVGLFVVIGIDTSKKWRAFLTRQTGNK